MLDDILILLAFFVVWILLQEIEMLKEVKTFIDFIIASGLCFFIAYNVSNQDVHNIFVILGIICILMIPLVLIIKYIEKMK